MRKLKRKLFVESLETRRVLTAPTFETTTLTVADGSGGEGVTFSGGSTFLESTDTPVNPGANEAVTIAVSGDGGIKSIDGTWAPVHPDAIGAAGGTTFDLFLDSFFDVLVVDATLTVEKGTVFNDTRPEHAANDHSPPIEGLEAAFPDLHADLWLTTPGLTSAVDSSSLVDGQTVSHFDTTNEGAQSGFHWGSLTLIPDGTGQGMATLDVTIQTASNPTPLFDEINVVMSVGPTSPLTLDGAATFDLTVSTPSDILVIDVGFSETTGENVPGGWFNEAPGGPNAELDSWVTTPGNTLFANGDLGETELVSIFDTTADGSQDDFSFAQITLIPDSNGNAEAVLHGRLQTDNSPAPTIVPFEYHLRVAQPSFDVAVSAPIGTTVGNVTATDPDGDEISYLIAGGNHEDTFAVDPVTGSISTLKSLSGLPLNHTLVLQATANGESTTTEVSINVLAQNSAPEFPEFPQLPSFSVDEDAAIGTILGAYTATDNDGDTLRYDITSENFGEYFAYDSMTGEISVASALTIDGDGSTEVFPLTLQVTDAAGLSDTRTVNIVVLAADEPLPNPTEGSAPTFVTSTLTVVDRNSGGGATFGGSVALLESTNSDLNGSATFDLTVSTPTDVLVLDVEIAETKGDNVPGGWFNESVGGPDVAIDSWVTTPGSSIFVNGDLGNVADSGQLLSLFDTTDDGPQDNFSFAQITLIPDLDGTAEAVIRGTLQTADSPTPIFSWFEYQLRIGQTSFSLIENAPIGSTVGFVAATDVDGDEISYSIVGGNDSGAFAVDPETGRISTLKSLAGLSSNYTLVLQATANGESVTTEVSITVFEQARIPEFPAAEDFVVHESAPVGTVIGTFSATDDNNDDTLRYDINSGNSGEYFAYDSATGQISVAKIIYVDVDTTYPLELVVTDTRGLTDTATVNITVIAGERPAELPQTFVDEATFTVTSQGNAATFDVLRSYAVDEDSVANASLLNGAVTFDLAISSADDIQMIYGSMESPGLNVPGGFYAPYRSTYRNGSPPPPRLLSNSPELAYATWLRVPGRNIDLGSFATCHASQVFGLGASDVDDNGAQDDFLFARVTLIPDRNGNASAVFTGTAYTRGTSRTSEVAIFEYHLKLARALFHVDPNASVGATVGYVVAGDLDGHDISYSIVDGNDGDLFEINSATGEILMKKPLPRTQFSLLVEANANGQSSTISVTINAPDVPEVPNSAPLFPPAEFVEVGEHKTIGSVIGSLPATDLDGDAMTYGLVARQTGAETPVGNFAYDTQTGDIRLAEHFNVDDDTVFEIELTATDARGLSETATMQVTVMNVNRRPSIGNGNFEIKSTAIGGYFVGAVNAIDLDGDTLDWAIVSGNDDGLFSVEESTGRISVSGALTADTTYRFILEGTDPDGLSEHSTVTVAAIDPTPIFGRGGVSGDGDLHFWVPKRAETGTPVATLTATDPFWNSLSYEIIESSTQGLFAYDSATGELKLERAITPEDTAGVVMGDPNFRLMLQATNSEGLATTTEVVVVQGTPIPADDIDDGGPSATVGVDGIDYVATGGWRNIDNPLDTTGDTIVSPIDALVVINELNKPAYHTANGLLATVANPPWHFDVNGDSYVSPIDALRVINWLNDPNETASSIAFAWDQDQADEDEDDTDESPLSGRRVDLVFE